MKKEDADQLIRCVKECWWRIAILLLIPAIAAVAFASAMPWDALAAIGTLSASIIALSLGIDQIRRLEDRKEREAKVISATISPNIRKTARILQQCLDELDPNGPDFTELTKEQISSLWGIERITMQHILAFSGLRPYESGVLGQNVNFLITILEYLGLPKTKNEDFSYGSFIRGVQDAQLINDLRDVADSLEALSVLTEELSYRPPNDK